MNKIRVRLADWHKDNADIRRIREAVFIAEQHVPPELEWDSEDPTAVHFLALEGDYPIGTARLATQHAAAPQAMVDILQAADAIRPGDLLLALDSAPASRDTAGDSPFPCPHP